MYTQAPINFFLISFQDNVHVHGHILDKMHRPSGSVDGDVAMPSSMAPVEFDDGESV